MRRALSAVDLMLLGAVLLWALNITVTRYVLTHGFAPLAYSSTRYLAATLLFVGFTWRRERSFRVERADWKLVGIAASLIFANQLRFVYAVDLTNASTVGLLLGTTPIFVGVVATMVGLERPGRGFWVAAAVSFAGVGLIAVSAGSGISGNLVGELLGISTALTWGAYSVAVAPLMRRYSSFRTSALVLACGSVPLALVGIPELVRRGLPPFGWQLSAAVVYAIVGPLFLTNILWFTAIARVGPSRASLFANLEPFFAVLFALLLLAERLSRYEVAGGVAITAGIMLDRFRRPRREAVVVPGD